MGHSRIWMEFDCVIAEDSCPLYLVYFPSSLVNSSKKYKCLITLKWHVMLRDDLTTKPTPDVVWQITATI